MIISIIHTCTLSVTKPNPPERLRNMVTYADALASDLKLLLINCLASDKNPVSFMCHLTVMSWSSWAKFHVEIELLESVDRSTAT